MDDRAWDFQVAKAAVEIIAAVRKPLPQAFSEYEKAAKDKASGMPEPEAGWFVGDVLNVVNEMEMAKEV